MGLDELLRILREEAANEVRAVGEEAAREAERVVTSAREASARLRDAAMAREEAAQAARLRAVRDAAGLERERALLVEARRQLDLLRAEALGALPAAVTADDVARLATELVAEAGPVPGTLVVDPGMTECARRALAALGRAGPDLEIAEAPGARGGVELVTGAVVLDDTVTARLERAWPRAEPEIAKLLLTEE